MEEENETRGNESCVYEPMEYINEKMVIVGVLGTSIAILGMWLNGIAIWVLKDVVRQPPSPLIYLFTLAILDFFFMWQYILVMPVQIYFDYFNDFQLYELWNAYIIPFYTMGKITQTSATYLLVAASIERLMDVGGFFHPQTTCSTAQRVMVILLVIFSSIAFRLISYWEIYVQFTPECQGFARYSILRTELLMSSSYKYYSFYAVNVFHVFLPFCLLLLLNIGIVYRVRTALQKQTIVFRRSSVWQCSRQEENLKTATNMLITCISMYLISNTLNVVITILEHEESPLLKNQKFYTFSVDCINLLYVITSALRILICIGWSEKLRMELFHMLRCFCSFRDKIPKFDISSLSSYYDCQL